MKKIIVFGATGNIGAYFIDYCKDHLNRDEYKVIAVGRKKTNYFENTGIEYKRVDICNEDDFKKLDTDDVYAIVHLAGLLPAYYKDYNPYAYIDVNITGSLRILEYARKAKADRVIYSQTWAEQAGFWGKSEVLSPKMGKSLCYTGDHAFYTITKSMVTETMEFYHQEYGVKNFVFRLPNVYLYHPQMTYYVDGKERVIPYRYMIDKASKGEDLEIWGNPDAFKDILYVKDLCQMMFKALFAEVDGGTYNAGTGIKTSLREQIKGILEVFHPLGKDAKIIECPDKPGFTSFVMDIDNAKEELGYTPEYTYKKYLEDYKKERELKRFKELWGE